VARAKLYMEAGADAIFPEALHSADMFRAFAQAMPGAPLLANMTEFGRSPNLDFAALAAMGYQIVLYPVTALRAALRAAETTLAEILNKGHQRDALPRMLSRAELYDLLDYAGFEERDRSYFR
jgi:methylisocitrate lyase